eukprot:161839-Rhodomonas_salina.1
MHQRSAKKEERGQEEREMAAELANLKAKVQGERSEVNVLPLRSLSAPLLPHLILCLLSPPSLIFPLPF